MINEWVYLACQVSWAVILGELFWVANFDQKQIDLVTYCDIMMLKVKFL